MADGERRRLPVGVCDTVGLPDHEEVPEPVREPVQVVVPCQDVVYVDVPGLAVGVGVPVKDIVLPVLEADAVDREAD